MRRMLLLVTVVTGMWFLAAGGAVHAQDATPAAPALDYPELRMVATDFAFEVTGEVTAGYTLVTLVNEGAEPHHAQLMQLGEGRTMADLETALGQGPDAIFGLGQFAGGPSTADPGGQAR